MARRCGHPDAVGCAAFALTFLLTSCTIHVPAGPPLPAPLAAANRAAIGFVPPGPPRQVRGVLTDSLITNEVLRGAVLTLQGKDAVTLTSQSGDFWIDSVQPGRRHLLVRHPLLDSLGLDTVGVELMIGDGDTPLRVALPTPTELVASRCAAGKGRAGDGMILGVVRQAETDTPLAGVEVAAAWRGSDTTYAGGGIRERQRVRTNDAGQFLICRAPRFAPVELWARSNGVDSPRLRVQLGAAMFGAYDFSIESRLPRDSVSTGAAATGVLAGRVVTLDGEGLPNVTVQLDRPSLTTTTDLDGKFSFGLVPVGIRTVELRALGFRVSRVGINLRPAQRVQRDITLNRTVAVLGTVTVRAAAPASWDSVGFEERKRRGSGYFISQEALKGVSDLSTALRMAPGIRGRSNERVQRLIAGRGAGCYPAFIVNGVRFNPGGFTGPEAMIEADDVRAIEVYGSRLSTPPQYQIYGDCAVIVIWLRDPQREREARLARPGQQKS